MGCDIRFGLTEFDPVNYPIVVTVHIYDVDETVTVVDCSKLPTDIDRMKEYMERYVVPD